MTPSESTQIEKRLRLEVSYIWLLKSQNFRTKGSSRLTDVPEMLYSIQQQIQHTSFGLELLFKGILEHLGQTPPKNHQLHKMYQQIVTALPENQLNLDHRDIRKKLEKLSKIYQRSRYLEIANGEIGALFTFEELTQLWVAVIGAAKAPVPIFVNKYGTIKDK